MRPLKNEDWKTNYSLPPLREYVHLQFQLRPAWTFDEHDTKHPLHENVHLLQDSPNFLALFRDKI